MDFIDQIRDLAGRALDLAGELQTEEATKNALVMPFIQILGYNVFNPREVIPEFTADLGVKKGERVDYAIIQDGAPILLIECKATGTNLNQVHASQLYRYFSVTDARFSLLTNGTSYHFYTDLDAPNKMDEKPFLEFDLLDIKEFLVEELKKFTKGNFDINSILDRAHELKYTREIKRILATEYNSPSEDFVRFYLNGIYSGAKTQNVIAQFSGIVKRAHHQFINDRINERLKSALNAEDAVTMRSGPDKPADSPGETKFQSAEQSAGDEADQVETTEEELRAYYVVKAILHGKVDLGRIAIRDRIRYCNILLDDNGRRPICRFHFNTSQKYLGVFDADKNEERIPISGVDDIYLHAAKIKSAIDIYETPESEDQRTATIRPIGSVGAV